jgi:serine protease Do
MTAEPGVKAMGYGSGFIVSRNGLIMTNEHVLRNGSQIEVELLDGRKFRAKPLFKDGKNDLALLKINAGNLRPVMMGDSDAVELGGMGCGHWKSLRDWSIHHDRYRQRSET